MHSAAATVFSFEGDRGRWSSEGVFYRTVNILCSNEVIVGFYLERESPSDFDSALCFPSTVLDQSSFFFRHKCSFFEWLKTPISAPVV